MMNDKNSWVRNLLSGIFFLGGLCLIVFVILSLGKDKGGSQPRFEVRVHFRDVAGLMQGAPVRLAGVNVGTVSDIYFLDSVVNGRRVGVTLEIFERYQDQLKNQALFSIETEGILGEKLIEIQILETQEPFNRDELIMGEEHVNVQDLAVVFSAAAQSFTKTSEDLNKINYKEMSVVLTDAARSLSLTSRALSRMLDEARYLSRKTQRILDRVEQRLIDGNLFKVF